jgi:putative ABC transport system substrate-binding protein
LARPGGHVTGISDVSAEVTPKRLELLKQFAPSLRRVAVLYNADDLSL